MPSFNIVNYSLRTNKSIQRNLVFEGARILKMGLNLRKLGYVGLGSLWFTDFQTAHKALGVRDMSRAVRAFYEASPASAY
jgi:hypothetical protein